MYVHIYKYVHIYVSVYIFMYIEGVLMYIYIP